MRESESCVVNVYTCVCAHAHVCVCLMTELQIQFILLVTLIIGAVLLLEMFVF